MRLPAKFGLPNRLNEAPSEVSRTIECLSPYHISIRKGREGRHCREGQAAAPPSHGSLAVGGRLVSRGRLVSEGVSGADVHTFFQPTVGNEPQVPFGSIAKCPRDTLQFLQSVPGTHCNSVLFAVAGSNFSAGSLNSRRGEGEIMQRGVPPLCQAFAARRKRTK